MTGIRDELANNRAKLTSIDDRKSEVERYLAREHRKLTETDDTEMKREIRDRIRKLESVPSDIELEKQARLEALSTNRATLRSQINRIRETFRRLLHKDTTLAERIRTLSREQGITISSILTAIGIAISTLVLALTGGGGSAPVPAPKPPDKSDLKEWVKKHLKALGRTLANLAGKAAAALPGIIGSIVSWLLSILGKTATWLAENVWALVIVYPASHGCWGLASEMITKAPQGHPLSQRPQGPFFLVRGPLRSAVSPEGQPLTCRHCQLR